jgi:hypothetical protein
MHHINGAYTTYFNTKRSRSGHLFQGRYKAILIEVDEYAILGSKEFIAEIKDRFLGDQKDSRDLPALRSLSISKSFDDIEEAVDSVFPSDKKLARQVKLYFCHRYSGRKLKEIGGRFGIGLSGVTRASNRISLKAEKDKKIGKILKRIEKNIVLSNA